MSTRDDLALAINKATFAFGYEEGETSDQAQALCGVWAR